jgi:hypothetical protein
MERQVDCTGAAVRHSTMYLLKGLLTWCTANPCCKMLPHPVCVGVCMHVTRVTVGSLLAPKHQLSHDITQLSRYTYGAMKLAVAASV